MNAKSCFLGLVGMLLLSQVTRAAGVEVDDFWTFDEWECQELVLIKKGFSDLGDRILAYAQTLFNAARNETELQNAWTMAMNSFHSELVIFSGDDSSGYTTEAANNMSTALTTSLNASYTTRLAQLQAIPDVPPAPWES